MDQVVALAKVLGAQDFTYGVASMISRSIPARCTRLP